ncbi:condensation domain-containing protein [Streptomyces yangpuensis]|uniref:condensation domain-containing protein n=1 Tax=Streptomyces yangpuensis TaxID=1648182 RepID=UPI0035DDE55B
MACATTAEHRPFSSAGLPVAPCQQDMLLDVLAAGPVAALHVEQLHLRWHGPLDRERFRAAWQSVADRETVLRACFAPGDGPDTRPTVTVREQAVVEVCHHPHGSADWYSVILAERRRVFDLRRPGALRVCLVEEEPGGDGPLRVVLTWHHALLDDWSVRLLWRSVLWAYARGGVAAGGARRPDLGDHVRWVAGRETGAARAFWSVAAPDEGAVSLPVRPGSDSAGTGLGRASRRLSAGEARRLWEWAAGWGVSEGTALHAVWALMLRRVVPGEGPVPVVFGMTVSGRGVALEGVERLPGPLRNVLPLSVAVDPATGVGGLLADVRDGVLGLTAYEWVSAGQIQEAAGHPGRPGPVRSLVSFARPLPGAGPDDPLPRELAAEGVRVTEPETVPAHTGLPLSLTARHTQDGELVLTLVHDRAAVGEDAAAVLLAQTALLLRELPARAGGQATVADALGLLDGLPVPGACAAPGPEAPPPTLHVVRPGTHPAAGTVLLVPPLTGPAADAVDGARAADGDGPEEGRDGVDGSGPAVGHGATGGHEAAEAAARSGPEALVTVLAPGGADDCLQALRPVLASGEPLTLLPLPGAEALAHEVAGRIAAHGWRRPPVAGETA